MERREGKKITTSLMCPEHPMRRRGRKEEGCGGREEEEEEEL